MNAQTAKTLIPDPIIVKDPDPIVKDYEIKGKNTLPLPPITSKQEEQYKAFSELIENMKQNLARLDELTATVQDHNALILDMKEDPSETPFIVETTSDQQLKSLYTYLAGISLTIAGLLHRISI